MKTSVIVIGYHQTPVSAHMTMACLANIRKYTAGDYELILIEDVPKVDIRDDYHVLNLDKHIILDEYTNYTKKMNMAAEIAIGDNLVFIQNDCFVWEGWLEAVGYYLERVECIVPDQLPRSREYMEAAYAMTLDEGLDNGHVEDCMLAIRRDAFERTGGWNEDLRALVMVDFRDRCAKAGVEIHGTNKIQVTHITLATHYQDMDAFDKRLNHDSLILNHGVNPEDLND